MAVQDLIRRTNEAKKEQSAQTFFSGLENEIRGALTGVAIPSEAQSKLDKLFGELSSSSSQLGGALASEGSEGGGGGAAAPGGTPAVGARTVSTGTPRAPASGGTTTGSTHIEDQGGSLGRSVNVSEIEGAQNANTTGAPPASRPGASAFDVANPDRDVANPGEGNKQLTRTGEKQEPR